MATQQAQERESSAADQKEGEQLDQEEEDDDTVPPDLVAAANGSMNGRVSPPQTAMMMKSLDEDMLLSGRHPLTLDHVIGASIFNESKEDRQARGKAECTSAAVQMLNARNVVDELQLQIQQMEKQFADIDAKFMKSMTFLFGGGFKDASEYIN